jgi:GntR family transcriptional regulator
MVTPFPQAHLPLYLRIEQTILDQIQNNQLKPGDLLPSEAELAQQYQVSRITAKRALDDLVHQGRAFRQQGRGTFVAQARIREISGFRSFSEDIRARGGVPASKVLVFEEITPDQATRAQLRLDEGETVFLLKRLRLADDDPVAIETAVIPTRCCPGLLGEDLTQRSLYAVLREKYQVLPTWADAEIEARPASKEEANLLGIRPGKPVLAAHRVTFMENYDVIESVDSVYRGDRFTFYTGRQFIG